MLAVNLGGVCLCMKHELAVMVPRGRGTIVNTSSVAGLVGTPQSAPYTAAKHGVVGLTRTAALEHGRNDIRVNAIAPGFTRTPMVKELFENPSSEIEQLLALSPLGRVAEPSEIAEAALWPTSPASSSSPVTCSWSTAASPRNEPARDEPARSRAPHRQPRCPRQPRAGRTREAGRDRREVLTMLFDFGRPTDGIFQTAFVVEDLDAAIEQFSARLTVGPWTTMRAVGPEGAYYRGNRRRPQCASGSGSPDTCCTS